MTYKGKGTYVSRDDAAHKVVIEANGRDSRGNGTANATVTASLVADGPDKTAVSMETDMTITGKPAQFGRGVISDVADKIIGQFSACVARKLAAEEDTGGTEGGSVEEASVAVSAASAPASPTASATSSPASEAISDIPTPPAAKRSAPSPAGGSEAISDSVSERSAATNGAAPAPATGTPVTPSGTSEAEAPASATMAPDPATTTPVTPATTTVRSAAPPSQSPVRSEVDAIDLLDTAGAPVLKRLAPVAGGGLLLLLVILLVRRLRSV
jgi:hypothetical protein